MQFVVVVKPIAQPYLLNRKFERDKNVLVCHSTPMPNYDSRAICTILERILYNSAIKWRNANVMLTNGFPIVGVCVLCLYSVLCVTEK